MIDQQFNFPHGQCVRMVDLRADHARPETAAGDSANA